MAVTTHKKTPVFTGVFFMFPPQGLRINLTFTFICYLLIIKTIFRTSGNATSEGV